MNDDITKGWQLDANGVLSAPAPVFAKYRRLAGDAPAEPTPVITILNYSIGHKGELSTWGGKAKSAKTRILSAIIAEILKPGVYDPVIKCDSTNPVLWIDTEQSDFWGYQIIKRVLDMGVTDEDVNKGFFYLNVRGEKPAEAKKALEEAIAAQNFDLVILDGSRDLVTSINEETEATDLISDLMKWAKDFDFHLANILHENKNDNNLRGHLGTELMNKSEFVLKCSKDSTQKGLFSLECEMGRGPAFEDPVFYEIVENSPKIAFVDAPAPEEAKKDESITASPEIRREIAKAVFGLYNKPILGKANITNRLMEALHAQGFRHGERPAWRWLEVLIDKGFIQTNPAPGNKLEYSTGELLKITHQ